MLAIYAKSKATTVSDEKNTCENSTKNDLRVISGKKTYKAIGLLSLKIGKG